MHSKTYNCYEAHNDGDECKDVYESQNELRAHIDYTRQYFNHAIAAIRIMIDM